MEFLDREIKIKLLNGNATLPKRATEFSSGFDLFSSENTILKSGEYKAISTSIAISMPNNIEGQIRPRSGLALKYGITLLNSPGTIDPDYRGEIKVILINHSDNDFIIEKGMRIAQIIFTPLIVPDISIVDELPKTDRGVGGFGSTGLQ